MQTGSSYRSVQPFVVRIVRGFGDQAGGVACSENLDFELGPDIAAVRILSWGQDMDAETLPFQCNLGYPVPRTKAADHVGETRLEEVRTLVEAGRPPFELTLVSLVVGGRPIGDYAPDFWLISASDGVEPVGYVTSPSYPPELETNIAMDYPDFRNSARDSPDLTIFRPGKRRISGLWLARTACSADLPP